MSIELNNLKRIHFVGIGGVSMSKLCAYCISIGIKCSGSDKTESKNTMALRDMGVDIKIGEAPELSSLADLTVYSAAVPVDFSDLKSANKIMERKYFLSLIVDNFPMSVAISGAHGKTTVTGMVSWVLSCIKYPFTAHIGGEVNGMNSLKARYGDKLIVTEACEYSRSFLELTPYIGVVLNIDYDHPDCYDSIEDTYLAFSEFALLSNICIYNDEYNLRGLAYGVNKLAADKVKFISYGNNITSDYSVSNISDNNGKYSFDISKYGKYYGSFCIFTYNSINVNCALACIAICDELGIDRKDIASGLMSFPGVKSRFECLGMLDSGARVFNDYAHHPGEIEKVLVSARKLVKNRLIAVFQPHTYSRTAALKAEFTEVFKMCDITVILPTYSARELPNQGITSYELYVNMKKANINCIYMEDYATGKDWLMQNTKDGDIVLIIGAGIKPELLID